MTPLEVIAQEIAQEIDHQILMAKILVGVCFFNFIALLVVIIRREKE